MFNGVKVFDVHGHVSAPAATRAWVAGILASNTARKSPLAPGGNRSMGRGEAPALSDENFQKTAEMHANYMSERNIDVQIIGPRPFMMLGWMQPHLLNAWSVFVNDQIKKQVDFFPDRFIGAAQLPQISEADDLKHCLPELERCVNELGFKAIYLAPDPSGSRKTPGMHEPYWYPVYEYCQRNNLPIIVHGTNCTDPRIGIIPENYQIGFVWEQYLATQLLSHSDVFDKFPELRVCVCHAGGSLHRFIPTDNHLGQRDLSKNLFFDTCVYDIPVLEAALKQKGRQALFGTEAPGSGGAVRPETGKTSDDILPYIAKMDFLSDEDKTHLVNTGPKKFCPAFN